MADIRVKDLAEASVPGADYYLVTDSATDGVKRVKTTNVVKPADIGAVALNGALGTPTSGIATNLTGTAAGLTAGNVTTNANMTGDVTSVGNATTIAANAVTNAKMAAAADGTIKSNISGASAAPSDNTISAVLDKLLGTTQGSVIYRSATAWAALAPGPAGQVLSTGGAAENPSWAAAGAGDMIAANNLSDVASVPTARSNLGFPAVSSSDYRSTLIVNSAGTAFQIMKRVSLLPDDFGWVASDTLANRHAALVAWAADPRPGILDKNTDYYIDTATGPLTVAAGKIIEGNGAYILDTTNNGKLLEMGLGALDAGTGIYAGNWQLHNLRLKGSGAVGYVTDGYGIHIAGVYNKATNAFPNYVLGGLFDDLVLEDIGFAGIWSEYVRDARRNNIKVDGVGYAGFMHLSEIGNRTFQCVAQNIGPGTEPDNIPSGGASTSYGFAFTRKNDDTDLTTAPRSADCVIDGWRVINQPNYTAVDTHSGDTIKILNGYAFGVFKGINIGYEIESADAHGALRCIAKNNTLFGLSTASKATSMGILLVGLSTATNGYTKDCIVEGNYIESFGDPADSTAGGIFVRATENAKIKGNTAALCRTNGISLTSNNTNFTVSENTIRDPHGTGSYAAAIGITGAGNTGNFQSNFGKMTAIYAATNMNYGYYIFGDATNVTRFLRGDSFTNAAGAMTNFYVPSPTVAVTVTWSSVAPT